MSTPQPTFEVTNYETMNKFLMGTLTGIRNKSVKVEEAQAISQVADKIIKNNLTMILESKRTNNDAPIEFFHNKAKQIMIGSAMDQINDEKSGENNVKK